VIPAVPEREKCQFFGRFSYFRTDGEQKIVCKPRKHAVGIALASMQMEWERIMKTINERYFGRPFGFLMLKVSDR